MGHGGITSQTLSNWQAQEAKEREYKKLVEEERAKKGRELTSKEYEGTAARVYGSSDPWSREDQKSRW